MKKLTAREKREHIIRILFRYDFHDREEFDKQVELYFEETNKQEDEVFSVEVEELDRAEIVSRINAIITNISDIDAKISDACDKWKIERIGKAELTILRNSVYEIVYDESIDTAVSINEAVELAKKYCEDKSPAFVNGILAKVIK